MQFSICLCKEIMCTSSLCMGVHCVFVAHVWKFNVYLQHIYTSSVHIWSQSKQQTQRAMYTTPVYRNIEMSILHFSHTGILPSRMKKKTLQLKILA